MTTARGMPTAAHSSHSCTVAASTPLTAETTNSAPSAARNPARSSPTKSGEPGVSRRVSRWSACSTVATPRDTERCWRTSTSSLSRAVVPSSMRPARGSAPVATNRPSASVVLPEPAWPTSATLRTFAAGRGAGAVPVSFGMSRAAQPRAVSCTTLHDPAGKNSPVCPSGDHFTRYGGPPASPRTSSTSPVRSGSPWWVEWTTMWSPTLASTATSEALTRIVLGVTASLRPGAGSSPPPRAEGLVRGDRLRPSGWMPGTGPGSGLLARRDECERLSGLVAAAKAGRSQVLVLRGEPGIGKTALLEFLLERAAGCRVARASGVESELELAFAGLHQLCGPYLDHLEKLPPPQGDALATAFGLRAGSAPDRFLVGLAVLTLLCEVAEERPLFCVVDDAQWLDQASAQTLEFVARRLVAEPVAMVFAVRDGEDPRLAGLPELLVGGLPGADAAALLHSAHPGPLDPRIRDRILAE